MLNFEREQKIAEIGDVKIGGQPGENPVVVIGTIFYARHKALLDEKTGKFDKNLIETEINGFINVVEETGLQATIDVVGAYPEALLKECEYIADLVECPFLVDGLNDTSRIPAMQGLKEIGLLDRAILNSLDENTSEENIEKIKEIGVKNAILLTFGNKYVFPHQKLHFLQESLLPKAEKANIKNLLVDTAVLDLPSISVNFETVYLVKNELGYPSGFAPSNAIFAWEFIKQYGDVSRCGAIASIMTYCVAAGSDFILFGPVKFAKCVIPSIALISGVNAYYRKRIKRKSIAEKTPLKFIF
jgi:tetrahydromethanopterin S-methyltransferase subunit H